MMVFWIGLNILATEALRTLLGADVPAWAVLLASSGPLYVVAMHSDFRHVHSGNALGQYDWQYIVCRSH